MSLSKVLSLALFVAVARASPIHSPSRILRRDPPAPSAYPLGDACGHEWQYLNFNPDDNTNRAHLQKLHDVICSGEMRAISSYGQASAQDVLAPYKRFFPESDPEDDFQTHVKDVLGLIAGTSSTDGAIGSVVGTFVVDNLGEPHIRSEASSPLLSSYLFVISADPFRRLCHEQQRRGLQQRKHLSLHTPRRSYRPTREDPFLRPLVDSWKCRRRRLRILGPLP